MKLNPLQTRTLALLQELAQEAEAADVEQAPGAKRIHHLPHAHGDHVHIGRLSVSARDASGLNNRAVWTVLERRGLIIAEDFPHSLIITAAGLAYQTGLDQALSSASDH